MESETTCTTCGTHKGTPGDRAHKYALATIEAAHRGIIHAPDCLISAYLAGVADGLVYKQPVEVNA